MLANNELLSRCADPGGCPGCSFRLASSWPILSAERFRIEAPSAACIWSRNVCFIGAVFGGANCSFCASGGGCTSKFNWVGGLCLFFLSSSGLPDLDLVSMPPSLDLLFCFDIVPSADAGGAGWAGSSFCPFAVMSRGRSGVDVFFFIEYNDLSFEFPRLLLVAFSFSSAVTSTD